ncbi:unnamed protein product [Paramecium octaurelia]|uniref:Uncharacterized protein n=1 Tax=Paramecium octaurelia TaxID=43137 RepID=A0A8S1Y5A9_PAROT|nr:unnamed protein product [Paramecium octaurelia]
MSKKAGLLLDGRKLKINYNYLNLILCYINLIKCLNKEDRIVNRKYLINQQAEDLIIIIEITQMVRIKMNKELFDFLTQINLQQFYGKIAQLCNDNLQQFIEMKSFKDIKDLPFGYQIKLQKAIEKMAKEPTNKSSKMKNQCCYQ